MQIYEVLEPNKAIPGEENYYDGISAV